MTTRSLTDIFILMRNNTIRSRSIYSEQCNTENNAENMHLIPLLNYKHESKFLNTENPIPPIWINHLEKAHILVSNLNLNLETLKCLQEKELHRPAFCKNSSESAIENATNEISILLNTAYHLIKNIKLHRTEGNLNEILLNDNAINSIIIRVRELSIKFKSMQNSYRSKMETRELHSQNLFGSLCFNQEYDNEDGDVDNYFIKSNNTQNILYVEDNIIYVQEQEREVNSIANSIIDLNDMFIEINQLVSYQGTILDRIDYNLEVTQNQTYEGCQKLKNAEMYRRGHRKWCTIIVLVILICIILFIGLSMYK